MSGSLRKLRAVGPSPGTILAAIAFAAALPPWDLWPLAGVALVPWLEVVSTRRRYGQAALQGFWLAFVIGLLVAPWIAQAAHTFLELSWPGSVLVLLVFAALTAHPHLVVFAPVVRASTRAWDAADTGPLTSIALCIALALVYVGLEWIVPRLFDVGLGYALHASARLRQPAELGGVPLLTFALVAIDLLVWRLWALRGRGAGARRSFLAHGAVAAAIVAGGLVFGQLRLDATRAATADADRVLRIGVVQGSVENAVRLAWARGDDRAAEEQLRPYMLLTEELRTRDTALDLVVWPEATYPGVFRRPATTLQRGRANKFDRQVLRLGVPIVFGAYDMEGEAERATFFNALFLVTPAYERVGALGEVSRYRKHLLLPFAETLPGPLDAEWIREGVPSLARFGRGPGAELFAVELPARDEVRIAPIICSESLSPSHVAAGIRRGGQLILNVGSDGWFGSWGEPWFHLAISRMRSVETRRPQVRAANTGISALILPDGSIPTRSAIGERTALTLEVPITGSRDTLMTRWGDWFGPTAAAIGLPVLGVLLWRTRTEAGRADAGSRDV